MCTMHQLVEQYVPLANKLASQRKRNLPRHVDLEDLRSAAYFGLVQAATRFEPENGACFSTFAFPRISGAIIDWLRSQKKANNLKSLDMVVGENGETLGSLIQDKESNSADECFEEISSKLDTDAKNVFRLYYMENRSMKEIGSMTGVSESRISQLIKQHKSEIRRSFAA